MNMNEEYTAPLSLIPGLGADKSPRVIDRELVTTSKWITAKLDRWSGNDASTTPQLEVMGDGKSVSVYVAVHHGNPPNARLPELFDAYKLADYLLDEHAENIIMNSIIVLGSDRRSIDGINVDYVMEYMSMTSFGEYERKLVANARLRGSGRTPMLINQIEGRAIHCSQSVDASIDIEQQPK
ncbi:hypothetical protein KC331_g993 [Hortaea werneckii]|nr:hypothetical protein KC331_g993 [Hortaea werneckii]KAI7722074.1 hypothetical protein KC353_g815 [Hortaea werneckii]